MPINEQVESNTLIDVLGRAVKYGGSALRDVPPLLKRVIAENRWQCRVDRHTGEVVYFDRFVDFVTAPPLEGLGADMALVKRMCSFDAEALDLLAAVEQSDNGGAMPNRQDSETAGEVALRVLLAVDSGEWHKLADLAQRHGGGALSFDAWASATGSVLERVARRAGVQL